MIECDFEQGELVTAVQEDAVLISRYLSMNRHGDARRGFSKRLNERFDKGIDVRAWLPSVLLAIKPISADVLSDCVRRAFTGLRAKTDLHFALDVNENLVETLLEHYPGYLYREALAVCQLLIAEQISESSHLVEKSRTQKKALLMFDRTLEDIASERARSPEDPEVLEIWCRANRGKAKALMIFSMSVKSESEEQFKRLSLEAVGLLKELFSEVFEMQRLAKAKSKFGEIVRVELYETIFAQISLEADRADYMQTEFIGTAKGLIARINLALKNIEEIKQKDVPQGDITQGVLDAFSSPSAGESAVANRVRRIISNLLRLRATMRIRLGQHKSACKDLELSLKLTLDQSRFYYASSPTATRWLISTLAELASGLEHCNMPRAIFLAYAVQREARMLRVHGIAGRAIDKAERLMRRRARMVFLDTLNMASLLKERTNRHSYVNEQGEVIPFEVYEAAGREERREIRLISRLVTFDHEARVRQNPGIHLTLSKIANGLQKTAQTPNISEMLDRVWFSTHDFISSYLPQSLKAFQKLEWPSDARGRREALYWAANMIAGDYSFAHSADHLERLAELYEEEGREDLALEIREKQVEVCRKVGLYVWGAHSAAFVAERYAKKSMPNEAIKNALKGLRMLRQGLEFVFLREDLTRYVLSSKTTEARLLGVLLELASCEHLQPETIIQEMDCTRARLFSHIADLADQPKLLATEVETGDLLQDEQTMQDRISELASMQIANRNEIHDPSMGAQVLGFGATPDGLLSSLRLAANTWTQADHLFLQYYWDGESMWVLPLTIAAGSPPIFVARHPVRLACSQGDIRAMVDLYNKKVTRSPDKDVDLQECLERLYGWLVKPIQSRLKSSRLVIVLSDEIQGVPFHALRKGNRFFIEDQLVSYVTSLSAISKSRSLPTQNSSLLIGLDNSLGADREIQAVRDVIHSAAQDHQLVQPEKEEDCVAELLSEKSYEWVYISGHGFVNHDIRQADLIIGNTEISHRKWMLKGPTAKLVFFNVCDIRQDSKIVAGEYEGFMTAALVRGSQFCIGADRKIGSDDAIRYGDTLFRALANGDDPVLSNARAMRAAISREGEVALMSWAPYYVHGVA